MDLTVNGTPVQVDGPSAPLADLLAAHLGAPAPPGVAVAVNDTVVPRAQWSAHDLRAGDAVEIVTAVQGG
ncbi:sulfur carrier protein ThiS [Nocardioides sp. SYSU D00065]|uniref:sulfur carrier protein ThiS n=1 Tax=Nocardioides sp. SYSU D00065 TaxID=2817378 RepID=UPI001B328CDF|nr:sulfur carrier protein ThiS [Nocardioides sp. SYSU D00065]